MSSIYTKNGDTGETGLLGEGRTSKANIRIEVLGTGSMAPYIPAAPKGKDPLTTVCAIVKPSSKPFSAISKGDLVVYQPTWAKRYVIHQAAKKQDDKWIMSGLHNRESEWFEPIGQDKFVCIIETT